MLLAIDIMPFGITVRIATGPFFNLSRYSGERISCMFEQRGSM